MTEKAFRNFNRVVLVSAPWPLFSRPSIQLGALKAYLSREFPDLAVEARHVYLDVARAVGYPVYSAVAKTNWVAEAVFAALLYPGRFDAVEAVYRKAGTGMPALRDVSLETLVRRAEKAAATFVDGVDWDAMGLVGFSVCLCQLTAALFLIRAVRRRSAAVPIVIGGSMVAGRTGRDLLNVFPEIDFVVDGEGEVPLAELLGLLKNGKGGPDPRPIPGVAARWGGQNGPPPGPRQIDDLDRLPLPDFSDYFTALASLGRDAAFFPVLPMEASRGCGHIRRTGAGRPAGCAFCNLNLQWEGYRTKSPSRVAEEVDRLTRRHKTLSVAFVDNLIPPRHIKEIFQRIRRLEKDFRLFGEIRATLPEGGLAAMGAAGMVEVQVGIEALSPRLLRRLNKGTSVIRNVYVMKRCEELGIDNVSNLILEFPGSGPAEVAETLNALRFVLPFRPLRTVRFWLGLDSPVWREPDRYGIRTVYNHPHYTALFPPEVAGRVRFPIQAYRGDRARQRRLWRPVLAAVKNWKKNYARLRSEPGAGPILSYRDGRDFLIVRQRRTEGDPLTHRLEGASRAIYLHCRRPRRLQGIAARFPGFGKGRIAAFLDGMVEKKLVFAEGDRYLSLAVAVTPGSK